MNGNVIKFMLMLVILLFSTQTVIADENMLFISNTSSDINGQYSFTDIPNGEYRIFASKYLGNPMNFWSLGNRSITIEDGQTLYDQNITITRIDDTTATEINSLLDRSVISGKTYLMAMNSQLYKNCTIVLMDNKTQELIASTTSNNNGEFTFNDIPNGEYRIIAVNHSFSGYYQKWMWYNGQANISISSNDTQQDIILSSSSNIDQDEVLGLLERSNITGRTYLMAMNTQFNKSCTIVLLDNETQELFANTTSNNNGDFTFTDIPNGEYRIIAVNKSFSGYYQKWMWYNGQANISINSNDTLQNIVLSSSSNIDQEKVFTILDLTSVSGTIKGNSPMGPMNIADANVIMVRDKPTQPPAEVNITCNGSIAFIVIGTDEAYMVEKAAEGLNINVTVYFSERDNTVNTNYTSFGEMDLAPHDAIFVYPNTGMLFLGTNVRGDIVEAINETARPGVPVIDIGFGTGNTNLTLYPEIENYCNNPSTENIKRLIAYIAINFCGAQGNTLEPMILPADGIYHPDTGDLFENLEQYLDWYSTDDGTHHVYNPDNHTVGLSFFDSRTGNKGNRVIDDAISRLEDKGINVIPAFRPSVLYENSPDYFRHNGEWLPDAFIDFGHGVWVIGSLNQNTTYLQQANVPVINAIMYQQSLEDWNQSETGSDYSFQYQIPIMEIGGHIESIVVSAETTDEHYGIPTQTPIPAQMEWMIDRTLNWVKLQDLENEEKKVALIYYDHSPGKQNMMIASNLNVAPSIANLLDEMNTSGYYMGEDIPNSSSIQEMVLKQGRNIGNWAPGELEEMVNSSNVTLLPVETYEQWFTELPEDKRNEVIDTWGEVPGDCMIYENTTGKYFVFPGIRLGNVMLLPQPTRGASADDSLVYHDQTLPPGHQYIAFYMWLNKEFNADAVINFGRHGTQEWLAGKGVGLSIEDCWPAIMIQDMPSIYIYDVGGIGEGIQAKRRGNAVIVDHLTPPIKAAGLYGNLSLMHQKMHLYSQSEEPALKQEYRNTIIEYYDDLEFGIKLGVNATELESMNETQFEAFVLEGAVHDYLHELADQFMPYGLHVLGKPPQGEALVAMVNSMIGSDLEKSISKVVEDEHLLDTAHEPNLISRLLTDVILNSTTPDEAVMNRLNISGNLKTQIVATTQSDENGSYVLEDVPNGNYTLYSYIYVPMGSTGMWFLDEEQINMNNGNDLNDLNLTAKTSSESEISPILQIVRKGNISGTTLVPSRSGGNTPYAGTNVLLTDNTGEMIANTTSDGNGNYTLKGVPEGNYTLTCYVYIPMGSTGMWFMKQDQIVMENIDLNNIDLTAQTTAQSNVEPYIELLQKASISGITYLPSRQGGNTPYANVTVLLTDSTGGSVASTISDISGNYSITNVSNGNYSLHCFIYVPMGSTGMWFADSQEISIQNGNDLNYTDLIAQSTTEEAIKTLTGLLQRANISGTTFLPSRQGGTTPSANVNLLLISKTAQCSEDAALIIEDLNTAILLADSVTSCSIETHRVIEALNGEFIPPGLGDDPIRSLQVLPTGRNFYEFNPFILPTEEAWNMGKDLAEEFLDNRVEEKGEYPQKVGFVLWSSETGRHKGVMESEILYLLGVRPKWDQFGNLEDVELIDSDELGRPRIDVVVTMSGVYRDEYKWQVQIMDRAARLAAQAGEETYPNYVKAHSDSIYGELMDNCNCTHQQALELSKSRIFGPSPGTWGVGEFASAVERCDSWENESILANIYIDSMCWVYGDNVWGQSSPDTFRLVLSQTDSLLFSRSGNDNRGSSSLVFDHVYEFYGGFISAVREVCGEEPEKFIVDLKSEDEPVTETFEEYLITEMISRYYNPEYIRGLMSAGYAGASEITNIFEDLAGLEYLMPDDISDSIWQSMYNIYIEDAYGLGLDQWYQQENPWAKQSIETKMLEIIRNGHWEASEKIKQKLARDIVESVAKTGSPSCCHHTCGNILNTEYILSNVAGLGRTDPQFQKDLEAFVEIMEISTGQDITIPVSTVIPSSSGTRDTTDSVKIVNTTASANQSMQLEGGYGQDMQTPSQPQSTPDDYIEGYEMQKASRTDTKTKNNSGVSSADILGALLVFSVVGAVMVGYVRKR